MPRCPGVEELLTFGFKYPIVEELLKLDLYYRRVIDPQRVFQLANYTVSQNKLNVIKNSEILRKFQKIKFVLGYPLGVNLAEPHPKIL